jgi:uncharacterized protein (DUF305 family)
MTRNPMKHLKKLAAAAAAATLLFGLTACGDDGTGDAHAEQTAPNGDVFNDADVDFATGMIPHHAQALVMVDLTRGRDLSPEVQKLADDIQAAQGPEIEQMVGWLNDWDKPVPETARDHANAEDDGMSGHDMGDDSTDMPGMMTDEEMNDLESAQGQEFETMWLEMMIEHHEGAIEMAKDEQADGVFEPARKLAESVETSQQAEIDQMNELLAS